MAKLPDGDSMTFLEMRDRTGANGFDLHEVYWAPLAGDGPAEADVLRWLRAQLMVPYQRQSAPWRRLPRLRRGMLQQLNAEGIIGPGPQSALLGRYDDFGRDDACRQYPEGTAEQFLHFLDERQPGLSADARLWIGHTRAFNAAAVWIVVSVVLLTLVFAVLAGETLGSVVQFVQPALFSGWQDRYLLRPDSAADLYFTAPVSLLAVLVTLTWLLTLKSFLQQSLGDVLQWATYHETSDNYARRRAILERSVATVKAVLTKQVGGREAYDRVIVIAHSLGTVIAHDTLLALRAEHLARKGDPGGTNPLPLPLEKISHFVTYGSPIDKFVYFFEAQQSSTRRYEQLLDQKQGSILDPSFNTRLTWLNFHEEGDAISGPIYTSVPATGSPAVLNIYTPNALAPVIGFNHGWYTQNRTVMTQLWQTIDPHFRPPGPVLLDPDLHRAWMRCRQSFLLAVPWTLLASYLLHGASLIQQHHAEIDLRWPAAGLRWAVGVVLALTGLLGVLQRTLVPQLQPLYYSLLVLLSLALCAYLGPPAAEQTFRTVQQQLGSLQWSAALGALVPPLLASLSMAFTRWSMARSAAGALARTDRLIGRSRLGVVAVIVVAVLLTCLIGNDGHGLLAWAWWRNTLTYAALSLVALAVSQVIYAALRKPVTLFRPSPGS